MKMEQKKNYPEHNLYCWKLVCGHNNKNIIQGNTADRSKGYSDEIFGMNVLDDFVLFYTENAIFKCKYVDCKEITEQLIRYPTLELKVELALTKKKLQELQNSEWHQKSVITEEVYERVISSISDKTREELLKQDDEYCRLEANRDEMEMMYMELDKYKEAMALVKDYISIVQETDMRFADVSYMAAVKDTISLMSSLGFLDK